MQNHGILAKNMAFWQNHGIRFSCFCDFLLFLPVDNVYLSLRSLVHGHTHHKHCSSQNQCVLVLNNWSEVLPAGLVV